MRRVVILEGVCGAGKTTLCAALAGAATEAGLGEAAIVGQAVTYGPIAPHEDAGTVDDALDYKTLHDVASRLGDAARTPGRGLVVVDSLHLTHYARLGCLSLGSFLEIDRFLHERVAALVVLLSIDRGAIRSRAVDERRDKRPGFYQYARKFGSTDDAIADHFVEEQRQMEWLLANHVACDRMALSGGDRASDLCRTILAGLSKEPPLRQEPR